MKTNHSLLLAASLAWLTAPARADEVSLTAAPPVVVTTMPVAGAMDVDPALTEIKVTYSKAMQDGSWSWSTWDEENYPETTGKPKYLDDSRTCVLPVKLQPGKFYAIWLNSEKFKNFKDASGQPAVPYLLTFTTTGERKIELANVRIINRPVAEFPVGEDLSTPESACVAWQRANARKDAAAISRLSLAPIDPKQEEKWFEAEAKRDAEGLAIYLKALTESKIETVQVWRDDLANVITLLPFPEGKGRHPYSARAFGRAGNEWKNLGEERFPTLETAQADFERKKETVWQRYQRLKSPTPVRTPPAAWEKLLNEDQRAVLAWTDRQFRSYFDARTFAAWPEAERTGLETRCIDALNGPRSRDYYQAINTLGALRSTNGLPALRAIAYERVDKNNRDRWMSVRAIGLIGSKADVPELIHLVYHGNVNTRWWAQLALVQITGQNFGGDWNAWARWWTDSKGVPACKPEIIRWWSGQPEPDKLAASLADSDQKFLKDIKPK